MKGKKIGRDFPTYFIADIAANHDGNIERAKNLIYLAAEAGVDAPKFRAMHNNNTTLNTEHLEKIIGFVPKLSEGLALFNAEYKNLK
jgi:sialic acid synthase SpsE